MNRRRMLPGALLAIGLPAVIAVLASCGDSGSGASSDRARIPQATTAQLEAAGLQKLPLAPESARVDLTAPQFSNPTKVTNPLFPIRTLRSAILSGRVEGKPFHTETTLLPETRIIEWPDGRPVETLVSQYVAYLDGRIEEVALDHYAQADDGSVWYFGEDVFNYRDGVIADTEGTWLAGREGPPAMIMPANPKVGDTYRSENIPGLVFEEVEVKTVGKTVKGPHGRLEGAMIGQELHDDGSREDKTFAPGYGEFFTGGGGDVEAMALAVPADELPGPPPPELRGLSDGADQIFDHARSRDWTAASSAVETLRADWSAYRKRQVPPRIATEMRRALDSLTRAVETRDPARAASAAIDIAQSALDLELRHSPAAEVDRDRFELWARQILVDASAGDAAAVAGDVATLEWIRDRFAHTLDEVDRTSLDASLLELRRAVGDENLRRASAEAARLRDLLAGLGDQK